MGQSDWAIMDGSVDKDEGGNDGIYGVTLRRGVTSGVAKPNGSAGSFVYAFNSIEVVTGACALSCAVNDYAPIELPGSQGGGSIRGCVKRAGSAGYTGYAPFFFIGASGNSVDDFAYILGLEDANPSRIVLYKGKIVNGAPLHTATVADMRVLRYSAQAYDWDIWHHLRLDMIVNVNGVNSDVILRAYRSELDDHGCNAPVWEAIAFDDALNTLMGDGCFVDDCLGINSGSLPLAQGYAGFGFRCSDVGRRAYFDYIEVMRQTPIA